MGRQRCQRARAPYPERSRNSGRFLVQLDVYALWCLCSSSEVLSASLNGKQAAALETWPRVGRKVQTPTGGQLRGDWTLWRAPTCSVSGRQQCTCSPPVMISEGPGLDRMSRERFFADWHSITAPLPCNALDKRCAQKAWVCQSHVIRTGDTGCCHRRRRRRDHQHLCCGRHRSRQRRRLRCCRRSNNRPSSCRD